MLFRRGDVPAEDFRLHPARSAALLVFVIGAKVVEGVCERRPPLEATDSGGSIRRHVRQCSRKYVNGGGSGAYSLFSYVDMIFIET